MKLSVISAIVALASGLTAPAGTPPDMMVAPGVAPPPSPINQLTLPNGRLQGVSLTEQRAYLLDWERTGKREGDTVDVWLFMVSEPAEKVEGSSRLARQRVIRARFDCAAGKYTVTATVGYDDKDQVVQWDRGFPAEDFKAKTPAATVRPIVCDGKAWDGPSFTGHAAAVKGGRETLMSEQKDQRQ